MKVTEQQVNNLVSALWSLVAADNCNYTVEGMRYVGLFDDARKVLADVGRPCEPYAVPETAEQRAAKEG